MLLESVCLLNANNVNANPKSVPTFKQEKIGNNIIRQSFISHLKKKTKQIQQVQLNKAGDFDLTTGK